MKESEDDVGRGEEDPRRIQYDTNDFAGRVVKKIISCRKGVVVAFEDGDYVSFVGESVKPGPADAYDLMNAEVITKEECRRRIADHRREVWERGRRAYERLKKVYEPEGGTSP